MSLKKEAKDKTITFILASIGLVVGLAWNDAIKDLIEFLFPFNRGTLAAKFVYATILTFLFVLVTNYIFKSQSEK